MGLTTLLKRSHQTNGAAVAATALANGNGIATKAEPPVNDIDGKVRELVTGGKGGAGNQNPGRRRVLEIGGSSSVREAGPGRTRPAARPPPPTRRRQLVTASSVDGGRRRGHSRAEAGAPCPNACG